MTARAPLGPGNGPGPAGCVVRRLPKALLETGAAWLSGLDLHEDGAALAFVLDDVFHDGANRGGGGEAQGVLEAGQIRDATGHVLDVIGRTTCPTAG